MPSIKGGASYKQKKERYKKLNFLLDWFFIFFQKPDFVLVFFGEDF
jgi:hypothetical protein